MPTPIANDLARQPALKSGAGRITVTPEQIVAARDDDALLPWPVVVSLCGLSRSTLHRMIRQGAFAPAIRLSPRCTRFRAGDVRRWLSAQAAQ